MRRTYMVMVCMLLAAAGMYGQAASSGKQNSFFPSGAGSRSSGSFYYTLTTFSDEYSDLVNPVSINQGEIWDDPEYIVPLAFPFELNTHPVPFLKFDGLGFTLSAETTDPDILTGVAAFEADLIDRGWFEEEISESPIGYIVEGNPGSRIQKIEIKNAGAWNDDDNIMFINIQLWLYEGSNIVEFRYGEHFIPDPGLFYDDETGAIIGIIDIDQTNGDLFAPHLLSGPAANPALAATITTINGTPANGTVYRLAPPQPLSVSITGQDATSVCAPDGQATATADGGTEPYAYAWSTGDTTATMDGLAAGEYTVTVTDAELNTATASVIISGPDPLLANAGATGESAPGANDGTASANPSGGLPPYSFEWSNGSTDPEITDLAPGDYTVTVTDDAGCTVEEIVTVESSACEDITSIEFESANPTCNGLCDGFISIISVTGGTPPYSYNWWNGMVGPFTQICGEQGIVTITDSNGCTFVQSFDINEPLPLLIDLVGTDESAPGANDGTASATPAGGTPPYAYAWSNGGSDSLLVDLGPGTYDVTVTDDNGCTATGSVEIGTPSACLLGAVVTNVNCFDACDGSIAVELTGGVEPVTYQWGHGADTSSVEGLCAGIYDVTVTDADGCEATGSFTITEPEPLGFTAVATNETAPGASDGTAWIIPSGGTPPYRYEWSTGSVDSLVTDLAPGDYIFIVTDANGCDEAGYVTVYPFPCFPFLEPVIQGPSCFERCDGSIVSPLAPSENLLYVWSNGDTTNAVYDLCAGVYHVTVTDLIQGCSEVLTFILNHPDELVITVDEVVHLTDSTATSISITVSGGAPPYEYHWSSLAGFNSTEEDIADIEPDLYTITVIDAQGCVAVIDSIELEDRISSTTGVRVLDFRIYPNPANQSVHIELPEQIPFRATLYSTDGRAVKVWENSLAAGIGHLAGGAYVLKIQSAEKTGIARLIILK